MPCYPPEKAVDRGIDLAWGKQKITQITTSGILQGKSIDGMAKYLTDTITGMEKASAIRAARTATTTAENAGRMDSYDEANKRGLDIQKQWMATLDARTRHTHGVLDGVHIPNNKTFDNGCRYPADPRGDASEVYNCRCTLVAWFPELEGENKTRWARGDDGKGTTVKNQTFTEWQENKKGSQSLANIIIEKTSKNGIIPMYIESINDLDFNIYRSLGAKAKNYDVFDPETGESFHFVEGTSVYNSKVFAGKGGVKPLKEAVAEGLSEQFGGKPEDWQHVKGIGTIDCNGEYLKAEVHWFQAKEVGKHKFKIKEWLE